MLKIKVTPMHWMNANDPKMMGLYKRKTPEVYDEMIRQGREMNPRACAECFFYYHLKNPDGTIYGGGCTIDEDVMIMDMEERVADCPL